MKIAAPTNNPIATIFFILILLDEKREGERGRRIALL
jgi:hypothetical protein